jgi:chaperonin GroEL
LIDGLLFFYLRGKPYGYGYNAQTDKYEDLLATGVLDPAKVTINAIENAGKLLVNIFM